MTSGAIQMCLYGHFFELMDLSKAFDCLPHNLLLLKLKYHGLSENAFNLIKNYLSNRKQCVKLGIFISDFKDIYKGVPKPVISEKTIILNYDRLESLHAT